MQYRFDEARTPRATVIRKAGARGPFPPFTPPGISPWICAPLEVRGGSEPNEDRSEPHDGRRSSDGPPMGGLTSPAL